MKKTISKIAAIAAATLSGLTIFSSAGIGSNVSAASVETAYYPGTVLKVTQGAFSEYNAYSHGSQNAFDLGGSSNYTAPFTGKIVKIDNKYNAVTLQSSDKVYYADGTLDYMTVTFVHDNDVSDLRVNQVIKQGTVFYQPGIKDPTGKTTGPHVHIAVKRGKVNSTFYSGDVYPNDAFCLKKGTTVKERGGYAWSYSTSSSALVNGGVYTIQPADKNLYMSEQGKANFSNVGLSSSVNNASKWKANHTSNGWYFQNLESGKVLDIYGNSIKSGANAQVYSYNKNLTQYFTLKSNGNGSFIIETSNNRTAVDCYGSLSSLKSGSNIWCYNVNYDKTQLFRFNKVG